MDKKFNILIADLYRENQYKLYIHAYNLINDEENAKDIVKISGGKSRSRQQIKRIPHPFTRTKHNYDSKNKAHINEVNTDVYTAWTEGMYIDNQLKEYSAEDDIKPQTFCFAEKRSK